MNDIVCTVDFHVDDRPGSICAFLERISPILGQEAPGAWHLDLSKSPYIGPGAAAILVTTVLEARRRGQTPRVTLSADPPKVRAFCEFSGVNHYLNGRQPPTDEHPDSATTPIQILTESKFNDPDPIIRLIRHYGGVNDESEDLFRICMNEVIQNVQDHAESAVGCATCARFMKGSGQLRIAIVDRGLGISTTLRRRHTDIPTAQAALERVVQGGYSAKSRPNNRGCGISNLCAIVVHQFQGEIFIVSEGVFADGKAGRLPVSRQLKTRFPGTGVFFTMPICEVRSDRID